MDGKMVLVDSGNTRIHLYENGNITHLSHNEGLLLDYKEIYYINVKPLLKDKLKSMKHWIEISTHLNAYGFYETMGVDRRALCLSYDNALFISAGTAITVDLMEDGKYKGGFILLGLKAMLKAYKEISPALEIELNQDIKLELLAKNTVDAISYGIIAPIKAIIMQNRKNHPIYITGGDGAFLATLFENAIYDDSLIFKGMKRALENKR